VNAAVLSLLAGLFAMISGVNDGGALLGAGLKLRSMRPVVGLLALMVAVAAVPLVTAQVALTFTERLTSLSGPEGRTAMGIAVLAAVTVVGVLGSRGRPTSLTLAIVGGVTGAGLGSDLPVSAGTVIFVLLVGLPAPFVGAILSTLASRLLLRLASSDTLGRWHLFGFLLQCLAYAANDGQKMLAVFLVALGVSTAPVSVCALIGLLFGIGTLYGLPRAGRTLSREILASRPLHAVSTELASGTAVLGCAALGAPVSMTQAIAGGMIGAGVAQGSGRVRWHAASKIVIAWILTLPGSALLAGAGALILKGVTG
jgi:PiT family inorganic phosphate transporter